MSRQTLRQYNQPFVVRKGFERAANIMLAFARRMTARETKKEARERCCISWDLAYWAEFSLE